MSFSAPDPLSLAGLTSGLGAVNPAEIPASVRNGNAKAKDAYAEGLAFEQVLVQELSQQLAGTAAAGVDGSSSGDASSSGSSDDTSGATGGLLSASSAASGYASLIPQALTDSIMSSGGLGVAAEIASAIDPSINSPGQEAK